MQTEKNTKGGDEVKGDWVFTDVTANTVGRWHGEFELRHPNENAQ